MASKSMKSKVPGSGRSQMTAIAKMVAEREYERIQANKSR